MPTIALPRVQTDLTGASVRVRFADDPDPKKATAWIDVQLPRELLKLHGELEDQYVSEVHFAALDHALDFIEEHTQRLKNMRMG